MKHFVPYYDEYDFLEFSQGSFGKLIEKFIQYKQKYRRKRKAILFEGVKKAGKVTKHL